ncbi:MAG: GMC family oxidoreductase [Deltaproteobacteria bacterium]|nr:GMC family oxidoreductase [Deltaproteobacteria bacterium]
MIDGAVIERDLNETADVVVVGTGAGGAVAAAELAEAGQSVIVLEEGGYHAGKDMTGDPLTMFRRLYRAGGLTGTVGNAAIPVPMGACVGGTTTINSGTCYRAPVSVLRDWERLFGLRGFGDGALDEHYADVEKFLGVKPVPEKNLGRAAELFRAGTEKLGYAGAPIPRNEKGCRATGVCAFGCPRDAKMATHVSYVPRAKKAGARVFTRCRAAAVLTDRGRAVGVVARFLGADGRPTGHSLRVLANAVFVAAGAIHTPALLARSGLGGARSNVGRHLRIHPAVRVAATFNEKINGWKGVPQSYNVHHFTEEGIFIQGQFAPPGVEAVSMPFVGRRHKELVENYERLASFGALISDVSSGRVVGGKNGEPMMWYWMRAEDVRKMRRAVAITARIFLAAGAREVYPCVRPFPILRTDAGVAALERARLRASDFEMMAFHPMGTARMGRDPATSAVNPDGEHHAARGLYVADASLFPSSTKVNPQLTIMALSRRVARNFAEKL